MKKSSVVVNKHLSRHTASPNFEALWHAADTAVMNFITSDGKDMADVMMGNGGVDLDKIPALHSHLCKIQCILIAEALGASGCDSALLSTAGPLNKLGKAMGYEGIRYDVDGPWQNHPLEGLPRAIRAGLAAVVSTSKTRGASLG